MTTFWVALLLEATLKSTLCLALAGLVSLLLWRRSAAQRHLVWAAAIVAALLLPALQIALPEWRLPLGSRWPRLLVASGQEQVALPPERAPADGTPGAPSLAGAAPSTGTGAPSGAGMVSPVAQHSAERRSWNETSVLLLLWSLGATLALAPLALAFLRIARIAQRARRLDAPRWSALGDRIAEAQGLDRRRLDLRRAGGPITPLTWGVFRPVVILPESCEAWSDAQAHEVLVHEAGHVRRHDCLTQLLASAACVLYWFNPLVWLAGRQMLTERERACDDQVLLAGARASDYANDLLNLARSFGAPWSTSHVTTAMARRSQIAGRLLAVLDPQLDRGAIGRRSVLVGAAISLVVLLPLASATPLASAAAAPAVAVEDREAAPGALLPAAAETEDRGTRPFDLEAAARELRLRERAYAAALARGDLNALADFYTEGAQVAAPSLPVAYGRRSVLGLLQRLVDAGVTGVDVETRELFPVGELVCKTGNVRFTDASGTSVGESRSMTLWKNEDGTWRIHRDWATR